MMAITLSRLTITITITITVVVPWFDPVDLARPQLLCVCGPEQEEEEDKKDRHDTL